MRRRRFITLLGGAAAWPMMARGQQPPMPVIGFLGAATSATTKPWTASFGQRLRELGWIEGRNVAIEYRWVQGRIEPLPDMAAELARLNVNVIVTHSTIPVVAAKRATSVIPITGFQWPGILWAGACYSYRRLGQRHQPWNARL